MSPRLLSPILLQDGSMGSPLNETKKASFKIDSIQHIETFRDALRGSRCNGLKEKATEARAGVSKHPCFCREIRDRSPLMFTQGQMTKIVMIHEHKLTECGNRP